MDVMDPDDDLTAGSPLAAGVQNNQPGKGRAMPAVVNDLVASRLGEDQARINKFSGALDQNYAQGRQSYIDYKSQLDKAIENLRSTPVGPSKEEQWQSMMGAWLSAPGVAGAGRMSDAVAQSMAARRQAELDKQALIAKYGVEGAQGMIGASQLGIQQSNSQLNNANNRMSTDLGILQRNNNPNSLVIRNESGQTAPNQDLINAKAQVSGAEAAARMRAQMAGISDPAAQAGLMHTAQMIVDRKIPMPTINTRTPAAMATNNALTGMIESLDPNYNAQDFPIAKQTREKFITGPQGDTVRSLNVAMTHLEAMREWGAALNNGDINVVNRVKNFLSRELGGAPIVDFNTAKQTVAAEATKAINGARGSTLTDRVEQADHFSAANSPDQINGAIDSLQGLMGGQIHGYRRQFRSGLRGVAPEKSDTEFNTLLDPATIALETGTAGGTNIRGVHGGGNQPAKFASEAEAEQAFKTGTLRHGDRVVINGQSGTWSAQ